MNNFLLLSNVLLWVFFVIQSIFMMLLTKALVDFLNRFRIKGAQVENQTLKIGERAPIFRSKNQLNQIVKISDFLNKHKIIIFSSNNCGICKEIAEFYNKLSDYNEYFEFFVIQGKVDEVSIKEVPNFLHLIYSNDIPKNYMVQTVPTVFTLDKNNMIVSIDTVLSFEHLITVINSSLEKKRDFELETVS